MVAGTVESLLTEIERIPEGTPAYELFVPQHLTLFGQPIQQDMAMAVLLDRLLGKDLFPCGFEQLETGRNYKYRRDDSPDSN